MGKIVMRKSTSETLRLTALAAALLSVYGPALAEDAQGEVSVGAGGWTNDRHQAGMYDGMRDKGVYPNLDADVQKRDDSGIAWGLKIRNLGLQTREIKGEVERQGDIGGSFEYNRIVRDDPNTVDTRLFRDGTRQIITAPSIVPGTGEDLELKTVRDRYTAKFYKALGTGFTLNFSYSTENKDGNRLWGRGGQPEFAVEPINSTTRQWEAVLNYADPKLQLSGGYYGTSYENSNGLVITSQPVVASGTTFNLTLPLDNKSHEFFVNGGYNFTPTTRGTFKASYARATQNEFLPTARPGLIFPAGPPSQAPIATAPHHLNGRLDTTLLEAAVNSRPMTDLTVNASVRYRNLDDKTPLKLYANVTSGTGCTPTASCPVYNTPWSYKTLTGKADATYRLRDGYSLLGGAEYSSQDRWVPSKGTLYVPFRSDLDELTLRAGVRKAMSETVNGSLTYLYSDRDGGKYKKPGNPAVEPGENRINPMNIADRKRNKIRGMVDWAPMDRFTLTLSGEYSHDDYGGLPDGLEKGKAYSVGLDGSYQLSQDWSFNAWVTFDQTKADETTLNVASPPSGVVQAVRDNNLKETGTSFGVGLRGAVQKLKLGADLERFRSVNKYNQDISPNVPAGALASTLVPTPDITNKMLRLKAFAEYPIQKNAEIRATFMYEKWQTDDWTWMMFPVGGSQAFVYGASGPPGGTDGTTVFADQKQHSVFGGLRYIYRFE
jgi:MtrB/PioB family decaheme-associated outer membrane protein